MPHAEIGPVTEQSQIPPLSPWVVSSEHGRIDRTRDSIDMYEDRVFDKRAEYAAARTERHKLQQRGHKRVHPARDGYVAGVTNPGYRRWNSVKDAVIEAELAETVIEDASWILQSGIVGQAITDRHQERQAEVAQTARAAAAPLFEEADNLWRQELALFQTTQEPTETIPAEEELMDQPSPEVVVSIHEHLRAKANRKAAIIRARQTRAGSSTPATMLESEEQPVERAA